MPVATSETSPMEPTPAVWEELLRRAHVLRRRYANLREPPQSTWSLVNRAAQRFPEGGPIASDRSHFFAVWTRAMCSVLNDLYRRQKREERNGLGQRVPMDVEVADVPKRDDESLRTLDSALVELGTFDGRKALILTLRYFEGMTWQQIADALKTSVTSVRREWEFSKAWLRKELKRRGVDAPE